MSSWYRFQWYMYCWKNLKKNLRVSVTILGWKRKFLGYFLIFLRWILIVKIFNFNFCFGQRFGSRLFILSNRVYCETEHVRLGKRKTSVFAVWFQVDVSSLCHCFPYVFFQWFGYLFISSTFYCYNIFFPVEKMAHT